MVRRDRVQDRRDVGMDINAEFSRLFYEFWEGSLAGREYLVSNDLPESLEKLPRSSAGDVQRALNDLNRIGHLLVHRVLPTEFVASLVGKEVIRVVGRAKPLIDEARARREEPDYLGHIDRLLDFCREAYPDYEPKYYVEGRRGFGLTG